MNKNSTKKKAPKLITYLELNKKFGYGYQARLVMDGIISSVIDAEPFTLDEAYAGSVFAIEEINKESGYGYEPYKCIHITDEALKVNSKHDITSARMVKDIKSGKGELATPAANDFMESDGELYISGAGAVLLTYNTWLDEKLPKAEQALKRYCEYLAFNGYGKSASVIWGELKIRDKDSGIAWIRTTFDKYIKDTVALINYIIPQ